AESRFRSKVRTAVKEVEEALVRLASTDQRMPKADQAINGYKINLVGQQTLYQNGLGSLLDVETARRSLLSSELAQIELQQERVSAWIALYRAAGGGWQLPEDASRAATLPEGNIIDQGRHNPTSQSELPGGHS
ncbi:MAG: RND transporter, partial [Methylomonas sp.]